MQNTNAVEHTHKFISTPSIKESESLKDSERQNKTFYMGEHITPSNFPATVSYAVTGENWCTKRKKELLNPNI